MVVYITYNQTMNVLKRDEMKKKVGILGGTFDPPHIGHLIIANEVLHRQNLDEIWFIPTNEPPHKANATSSNKHRKNMVELAIATNDHFYLHDIELQRKGKSYTYDTIKQLLEMYDHQFYFIIGADMIEYLPKWNKIDELMKMTQFIGVKRSTYKTETDFPVLLVDIPMIDVSSTAIRERIRHHVSAQYLIQDSVYVYIKEHQLYEV